MEISAKAFAPVNIAWIKYMGKENGLPTNSSLSMTLDRLGTTTEIFATATENRALAPLPLSFSLVWDSNGYVPPTKGQEKVFQFLSQAPLWRAALAQHDFPCDFPQGEVRVWTENNVPAGTGIATSASAFAALTLAWAAILTGDRQTEFISAFHSDEKLRHRLAEVSTKGSGSSCRSFAGPWVEWNPRSGIHRVESGKIKWADLIVVVESLEKEVSSSDAHLRVKTSPHFEERAGRVEARLAQVKAALKEDHVLQLQEIVLDEARDMHDLFHTSVPPFSYLKKTSQDWIDTLARVVKSGDHQNLPSRNAVLTLDAGANLHVFIPENESLVWKVFLEKKYPDLKILLAHEGTGAKFL
jgi:diphosphomevalonate decarboxylase